MTAAMLTRLSSVPVTIIVRPLKPLSLVVAAKWITTGPRWLPASVLDTATAVPEPEPVQGRQRRLSPPDWAGLGLCSTLTPAASDALFFGVEVREAPGALIAAANKARELCAMCPVAAACLTNALVEDERYGVWGGTSGRQREKMRSRLSAGATIEQLVRECLPGHVTS